MANSVNENNGVVEINKSEEKSTSISQDFCEEKQTHSSSIESSLSLKKNPKLLTFNDRMDEFTVFHYNVTLKLKPAFLQTWSGTY